MNEERKNGQMWLGEEKEGNILYRKKKKAFINRQKTGGGASVQGICKVGEGNLDN